MKKFISTFLALVIAVGCVANGAMLIKADAATSGNYTYTISNGKATITDCDASISGKVTIPATLGGAVVTAIGNDAFEECNRITAVELGSNIEKIGSYAFAYCTGLKSIEITDKVTEIGERAFYKCTRLTTAIIGDGLRTIPQRCFEECENLESIELGATVTAIGERAFSYCSSLCKIIFNNKLSVIDKYAFEKCTSLATLKLPASMTEVEEYAFHECDGLTFLDTGNGLKIIHRFAFHNCDALKKVVIGNNVKSIGHYAFMYCEALNSLVLGTSLETIEEYAFSDCLSLKKVILPDSLMTIEGHAFHNCDSLVEVIGGKNVNVIENYAFAYSEKLRVAEIPENVIEISDGMFLHCEGLEWIVINENLQSIGMNAFSECPSIKDVFYSGSKKEWGYTVIASGNDELNNADYHYNTPEPHYEHEYNEAEPTCISDGIAVYTCVCGYKRHSVLSATGIHTKSGWIVSTKATASAPGKKYKKCIHCGKVLETAAIPQLKPATPKLSKIENTASGVKFTWGKVSGADSYIVYRKTYDAKSKKWGGWAKITTVKGNGTVSYTDKTAKSGVYYLYTVKATNEVGNSGYNANGIKTYFLSIPKVTSTANTSSAITIKWGKVTGASGYIVYRKTTGGWTKIATVKGNSKVSFTDKTAKAGVTYRYTVKAYYSSYVSAYNTNGYAVRRLTAPALSKVTSAKNGITFTWGKVTGATGYIVYRKTGNGGWQKLATVTGNSKVSYLDKTAKKGVTYTYTVRAYYGTSNSAYNTKGLKIKDKY